ncbi:RNA-directed RNA polymerase 2 [Ephemerocybe angulata]|uniref:RNA-dependent RNA polymerase n=1 Tax=Ephemerocybe angulata TaxID=980116 RepID=A0A8H6IKR5_9AGAR|nr:RNA-directed RNA polymerase 2 [Tulosesus angulatus]
MEIFMRNVSWSATSIDVEEMLAKHLHDPVFLGGGAATFNFNVYLPKDKKRFRPHSGIGFLTLPTQEIGNRFLALHPTGLYLQGRTIQFSVSRNPAGRLDVVQSINSLPYIDPRVREDERKQSAKLAASRVKLNTIQFGWDCRDEVLSIESEASPERCYLSFDEERRQFRVEYMHGQYKYFIAIRFSQIDYLTAHTYLHQDPVILMTLLDPPTFEADLKTSSSSFDLSAMLLSLDLVQGPSRRQLSWLPIPENHHRVAPYTSMVVRLICASHSDLERFRELSSSSGFHYVNSGDYPIERRNLFSEDILGRYNSWISDRRRIPWGVAFQIEGMVRKRSLDIKEMLDLLPDIEALVRTKEERYTSQLLRDFATKVFYLYRSDDPDANRPNAVRLCFEKVCQEFDSKPAREAVKPSDGSLCEALHVTITPTTMMLDGPYPERSNRVIRAYKEENEQSFLRVTFAEEGRLQLRFDKEVDSREYLASRVGPILFDGLTIAGETFEFLAYSQSALKEHSVWFVKPFTFNGRLIRAHDIIANLGTFEDLDFDPGLAYCPARYAARISQAFTATDASISVDVEEIFIDRDIEREFNGVKYVFTDGVGTISLELARDIWRRLKRTRRRLRAVRRCPAAFQIRFRGSKGMVSVDHTLEGRAIVLRQSMIKFEAPLENNVEIARAFDRPTPYFLNRPLIMLMEGLGVQYSVFKKFQDMAVQETEEAVEELGKAGKLLESYGLGSSFRISSVMNSLAKLGIISLVGDKFYDTALEFAKIHILRLLKNHARIPIPGAWTLVGVADIHSFLQPGEVFAYVRPLDKPAFYLQGPVVISRSPTIHPGDVQVAHAIGPPPVGSCFEKEPLANTVVFSILGPRPLPSCLGGGDLDGDVYNIIPLNNPELAAFEPAKTHEAAKYAPAKRKVLDRKSTMRDVAEFVMDYIVSDVLGIVAVNWMLIADLSADGIHDSDCMKLANLHSDAVDYPKSGNPVDRSSIPRPKQGARPDWNAPETVNVDKNTKYYPSSRAIGRLFRDINLPSENQTRQGATRSTTMNRRRRRRRGTATEEEEEEFSCFASDYIHTTIELQVQRFIATEEHFNAHLEAEAVQLFSRYVTELQGICITKTLSSARNAELTEEEALIGTIVEKTSQPRRRTDMISRLRESTDILVRGIREQIEGDEDDTEEEVLERAWFAWQVALGKGRRFGAQSFGWVTLGAIFEAIRKIEEREIGSRLRL